MRRLTLYLLDLSWIEVNARAAQRIHSQPENAPSLRHPCWKAANRRCGRWWAVCAERPDENRVGTVTDAEVRETGSG